MKLANLDYHVATIIDPRKAPKGKLPYIEDDGLVVSDSRLILDYLERTYGQRLDGQLDDVQRAQSLVIQRTAEEHLYWAVLWSRWVVPRAWAALRPIFFGDLPPVMRQLVPQVVRRQMIRDLRGQGMGRLDENEIVALADRDLSALSVLLGAKAFYFGNSPSVVDAVVMGSIANIVKMPIDTALVPIAKRYDNLVNHTERLLEQCYGG